MSAEKQSHEYGNIHFINERQRELFAEARFGQQVEDFLRTDIGRYLHGCASQDVNIAMQNMADIRPGDPKFRSKFSKEKFDYEVALKFIVWLGQAIERGSKAEYMLNEGEF